jgi:hypothetical protein
MRAKKKRILEVLAALGCLVFIFCAWIFLGRLKRLAYVDSAIGTLRSLVIAENRYAQAYQNLGYTCTLSALHSGELPPDFFKNSERNGYAYAIIGCDLQDGKRPNGKYQLTARPLVKGMAAFCVDHSGVVKYHESGSIEKCLESGVPVG